MSGSLTASAAGTGTITLPGGLTYNNVLQIKQTMTSVTSVGIGTFAVTFTSNTTNYKYFHPTRKFELLTIEYSIEKSSFSVDTSITIRMAKDITVGLTDKNFDASFSIFPNPAKKDFTVRLSHPENEACIIRSFDAVSREVKRLDYGQKANIRENIDISDLPVGIYLVKTNLDEKASTRKLVVE